VESAAFSPDGTRVVTACGGHAQVWDAATGQPVTRPLAHQGSVMSVAFSPDGTSVVTASEDRTARVWDLRLDNGTVADWTRVAERSPFILRGIAVVPRPPPSYLTSADASAATEAPRSTPPSSPPSPDERPSAARVQLP
jgi:WD40 repeat protein